MDHPDSPDEDGGAQAVAGGGPPDGDYWAADFAGETGLALSSLGDRVPDQPSATPSPEDGPSSFADVAPPSPT